MNSCVLILVGVVAVQPPASQAPDAPASATASELREQSPTKDVRTISLPPATQLALAFAENLGATTQYVELQRDESLSQAHLDELRAALRRTGLFKLEPHPDAVTLQLRRTEPAVVLATAVAQDGKRLWVGSTTWPADHPEAPVAEAQRHAKHTSSEEMYQRVLSYQHQRLKLQPVQHLTMWTPGVVALSPSRAQALGLGFGSGLAFGAPSLPNLSTSTLGVPDGFVILQGDTTVLDELELAKVIGDRSLVKQIEKAQRGPRLAWLLGFGSASVLTLGTGIWLNLDANDNRRFRDQKAVSYSLLVVGIASALLAALFPWAGYDPVLDAAQTQVHIDAYNTKLRRQLELSPDDIARFD